MRCHQDQFSKNERPCIDANRNDDEKANVEFGRMNEFHTERERKNDRQKKKRGNKQDKPAVRSPRSK
ncbi:MAG TPA: hypothetical protein VIK63_04755 [Haloplasmataceae bacterium]